MNLKIKLSDPNFCDDCPCSYMELGQNGELIAENCSYSHDYQIQWDGGIKKIIRPQNCKEENGP